MKPPEVCKPSEISKTSEVTKPSEVSKHAQASNSLRTPPTASKSETRRPCLPLLPLRRPEHLPRLRFTPYAWAKLHWLCHYGDTEIGGFAITRASADHSRRQDLLLVEDFLLVKQETTVVSVQFDDAAVADFFDQQIDLGHKPEQCFRIWCHTHPGDSPRPSGTDEETFARVFGVCDWAVMFILAKGGDTYARIHFKSGPGGQMLIPVEVDYSQPFQGSDFRGWESEYQANVHPESFLGLGPEPKVGAVSHWDDHWSQGLDPTIDQEELEMLARAENLSPDELRDLWEPPEQEMMQ